jgi:hypothetical protein
VENGAPVALILRQNRDEGNYSEMTESTVDSHITTAVERATDPPSQNPNELLAVWRVVTEVDLTSGTYPISRVRWRRVHLPSDN